MQDPRRKAVGMSWWRCSAVTVYVARCYELKLLMLLMYSFYQKGLPLGLATSRVQRGSLYPNLRMKAREKVLMQLPSTFNDTAWPRVEWKERKWAVGGYLHKCFNEQEDAAFRSTYGTSLFTRPL